VTDVTGATVWRWESSPFGETAANEDDAQGRASAAEGRTPRAATDGDGIPFAFNLRFPGQYYDVETGTHYNYFRDYNPATGRYVQSDPIGLQGGLNTYGYVGGSLVGSSDPLGLWTFAAGRFVAPALESVVTAATGTTIGVLLWEALNDDAEPQSWPWVDDPVANAEYEKYKADYKAPPPPFQDPCEELRWRLKREENLLRARQAWDAKHQPGRHAGPRGEDQSKAAIRKIKNRMKKLGCDC
jgi:RHS repeat-associated protein